MKALSLVSLIFSAVILAACAQTHSFGTQIDRAQAEAITKGVTTRAEIEAKFGQPVAMYIAGDGKHVANYQYSEISTPGAFYGFGKIKSERSSLQIIYNKGNVVEDYEYQSSASTSVVTPLSTRQVKE